MCDLAEGLKLCTCEGETLDDPDWVLERRDDSIPPDHRRGRALIPRYTDAEQSCLALVIAKLDDGSCFDFDYTPRDGDVLILRHETKRYRFRFAGQAWELDDSTSLTGWRAQMVREKTGRRALTDGATR